MPDSNKQEPELTFDDLASLDDNFSEDYLDALDAVDPEDLDALEDPGPDVHTREAALVVAAKPDTRPLPRAKDWRGQKLPGAQRTQQTAHYLAIRRPPMPFKHNFPQGLCLHYPVNSVWVKPPRGQAPADLRKAFEEGVAKQTIKSVVYARNKRTYYNTYFIIDYLGGCHQDCNVSDRGIHGHSANAYTLGVEIAGAGWLKQVKGEFYRSFDVTGSGRNARLKKPPRPSYPEWARRTVKNRDGNIRAGTYSLFSPAQVEAIFKLHADLMYLDGGREIYRSPHRFAGRETWGVTSHDVHEAAKVDVGGSLFTNIETFGEILDAYIRELLACGNGDLEALVADKLHAIVYAKLVLPREDYRASYANWRDEVPIWA